MGSWEGNNWVAKTTCRVCLTVGDDGEWIRLTLVPSDPDLQGMGGCAWACCECGAVQYSKFGDLS